MNFRVNRNRNTIVIKNILGFEAQVCHGLAAAPDFFMLWFIISKMERVIKPTMSYCEKQNK